jgi:pimeloyl-ACP methyl ester carboxylesterase
MKKWVYWVLFFCLSVIVLISLENCQSDNTFEPVVSSPLEIIDKNGWQRNFRLFFPEKKTSNLPLLVYFHAVASAEFAEKVPSLRHYHPSFIEVTGLIDFCREQKIVLLVPDALYEYDFLGCKAKGWVIKDEMNGIEMMIDQVVEKYKLDKKGVYLAGISAGAVLSHYLANRRPKKYQAILSHSQGYDDGYANPKMPDNRGPKFGVLFVFNKGDYPNLIQLCLGSKKLYDQKNYKTQLIPDVLPQGHAWSAENNSLFWKTLRELAAKNFATP